MLRHIRSLGLRIHRLKPHWYYRTQRCRRVYGPLLDDGERYGARFMMQRHRGDAPPPHGVCPSKSSLPAAGRGVLRAVKVEKDQAARGCPRLHTRDGFLSLVASFLEVHGGAGVSSSCVE